MCKKFDYEYIPTRNFYIVTLIGGDNYVYNLDTSICGVAMLNSKLYRSVLEEYNAIYPDTLKDPIFKVQYFECERDIINCVEKLNSILMITILKEN